MMKSLFISMLISLSAGCADDGARPTSIEAEILALVNEHRASINLAALQNCESCASEAQGHSERMAEGSIDFGHDGFDDRVENIAKVVDVTSAAENVAEGYATAKEVVEGWLQSKGHRENIEGDYTHLGTGIAKSSDNTKYFTQIFIKL